MKHITNDEVMTIIYLNTLFQLSEINDPVKKIADLYPLHFNFAAKDY